jgi:hypothetical protein
MILLLTLFHIHYIKIRCGIFLIEHCEIFYLHKCCAQMFHFNKGCDTPNLDM